MAETILEYSPPTEATTSRQKSEVKVGRGTFVQFLFLLSLTLSLAATLPDVQLVAEPAGSEDIAALTSALHAIKGNVETPSTKSLENLEIDFTSFLNIRFEGVTDVWGLPIEPPPPVRLTLLEYVEQNGWVRDGESSPWYQHNGPGWNINPSSQEIQGWRYVAPFSFLASGVPIRTGDLHIHDTSAWLIVGEDGNRHPVVFPTEVDVAEGEADSPARIIMSDDAGHELIGTVVDRDLVFTDEEEAQALLNPEREGLYAFVSCHTLSLIRNGGKQILWFRIDSFPPPITEACFPPR